MVVPEVSRDMSLVYPLFAAKVTAGVVKCRNLGIQAFVFEAWRSPQRQEYLYEQGRKREGPIVTKARGWDSFHQYGLAVDIACKVAGKWTWDFDTAKVAKCFTDEGLESLAPFESCHFQMTRGIRVDQAYTLTRSAGVQRLWMEVSEKK